MTIPEGVVGQDERAGSHERQQRLVGLHVGALVAIDESHVERDAESRCLYVGIADDEGDAIGERRAFYPVACEVLHLVVGLKGPDVASGRKSLGQAERTITAERAHFEHVQRFLDFHQHLQQPALQMAADHASVESLHVGGTPQLVQVFGFWLRMGQDVVDQCSMPFGRFNGFNAASQRFKGRCRSLGGIPPSSSRCGP